MLERCRVFYRTYPQLAEKIPSPLVTELADAVSSPILEISSPLVTKSKKSQPVVGELEVLPNSAPLVRKSKDALPTPLTPAQVLRFSWTQLIELLRLDDPWKRAFYENECLLGGWSKRQLQRQIGSLLYERTGLSKNKRAVVARARLQSADAPATIEDLIRDPYVLEFTGLADRPAYSENDLETALLNHVQGFLLELGTGFCFEARQFRITVGNEHDRIDLVFYHRRLRCHVLVDLKIRAFSHGDAGQMNFYLNYFKKHMMAPGDQPPVGILLCSDKDKPRSNTPRPAFPKNSSSPATSSRSRAPNGCASSSKPTARAWRGSLCCVVGRGLPPSTVRLSLHPAVVFSGARFLPRSAPLASLSLADPDSKNSRKPARRRPFALHSMGRQTAGRHRSG